MSQGVVRELDSVEDCATCGIPDYATKMVLVYGDTDDGWMGWFECRKCRGTV